MLNELYSLRNYAHLGDSIWEVFVRLYAIKKTSNSKYLHKITTDRVNATYQKHLLDLISEQLTNEELELVRRARNLSIPVARRAIQATYRQSTAFETLIGYWYLHDKNRLEYFYNIFNKMDDFS